LNLARAANFRFRSQLDATRTFGAAPNSLDAVAIAAGRSLPPS